MTQLPLEAFSLLNQILEFVLLLFLFEWMVMSSEAGKGEERDEGRVPQVGGQVEGLFAPKPAPNRDHREEKCEISLNSICQ